MHQYSIITYSTTLWWHEATCFEVKLGNEVVKHNTHRLDLVKHSILLDYRDQEYRATAQCARKRSYYCQNNSIKILFGVLKTHFSFPPCRCCMLLPSLSTLFGSSDLASFSYAFSQHTSDHLTTQLLAIHIAWTVHPLTKYWKPHCLLVDIEYAP